MYDEDKDSKLSSKEMMLFTTSLWNGLNYYDGLEALSAKEIEEKNN